MVIYIQERLPNGHVWKASASQLHSALCQANVSTQLKNAGVEQVIPKSSMSETALKYYLDTPPAGTCCCCLCQIAVKVVSTIKIDFCLKS